MDATPIVVSSIFSGLALMFTVGSFYWLQARKGRLRTAPVTTFSARLTNTSGGIRIPVTIYNSGARPRIISGVRLRLKGESNLVFVCHTLRKTLDATPSDTEDFFHPYAIPGRSVVTKYPHFAVQGFAKHLSDAPIRLDLEVLTDSDVKWRVLSTVELHTEIVHSLAYVTYSNYRDSWPDGVEDKARAYREKLAEGD